jgi:methionine-rich copper-binding protein CopC
VDGSYFQVEIASGKSKKLSVELSNLGDADVRARTYPADAFTLVNGGFGAKLDGEPTSGTTKWINYKAETFTLKAGEVVTREFTLRVPKNAKPGQYLTSIILQPADPTVQGGNIAIKQVSRQALPIAITVPGAETPKLEIGAASYHAGAASRSVQIELANMGNVHITPAGTFVLSRADGSEVVRQDVKLGSIFAGTSTLLQVTLPQPLDPGEYTVALKLTDEKHDLTAQADALPLTVAAVDASGTPAAEAPKIAITSVDVNELRDPSTKALQGVEIVVSVDNPLQPIASGRLTLHVSRDGQKVEDYVLGSSLTIPNGASEIRQRYLPATGWTAGSWTFSVTIDAADPSGGGVTELATSSVSATVTAP